MTDATTATYTPLPTPTSIRILVLAPALPSSPEINCYLLPSDLNSDHNLFPETSPRPIKSLSVMYTSPPLPGKPNEFIVWTDTTPTQPRKMHPFQRYSALSYVWGDPSDPVYINLDGRQVPITRNLYAALRAVRKLQAGKRLWVDALCIDQSDCEEKRVQIGLMRRVYEQAKRVVAFVPLEKGDGGRVVELVGRVCRAERLLRAEMEGGDSQYDEDDEDDEDGEDGEDGEDHTFKVVPQTDDLELQLQQLGLADPGPTKFLEKFGLPTVDSPLWVSWRRFFASPYFQRIWILQEFLSAKKVRFHFGDARLDASAVIVACYAIKEYSEVDNRAYMQRRGEELADSGQPHRGLKRAWLMFEKRVIWKKCPAALAELIVLAGQFFMATDLRDKVYALIGLAKDGQEYMGHVSYEPSETHIKVFTRFARLLIENGYAEELLRCSGISGSADRDPELPTWVPNWADTSPSVNPGARMVFTAQAGPARTASMRVLDDTKLCARGVVVDTIKATSKRMFPVSPSQDWMDWIVATVKATIMIRDTLPEVNPMEIIFELFIWKRSLAFDTDDLPRLKKGFEAFLGQLSSLSRALPMRDKLKGGETVIMPRLEPLRAFFFFKDRSNRATAGTRFCITEERFCGVAPEKVIVGDQVVVLDGNATALIVRDSGKGDGSYVLVGGAYFHGLGELDRLSTEPSRDIVLV